MKKSRLGFFEEFEEFTRSVWVFEEGSFRIVQDTSVWNMGAIGEMMLSFQWIFYKEKKEEYTTYV